MRLGKTQTAQTSRTYPKRYGSTSEKREPTSDTETSRKHSELIMSDIFN